MEARVKRQLLDEVRSITPKGVTIMHVRQGQAKGLGHAVLCAKPLVGDAPFAVVLPDVLIDDAAANLEQENLAAMVREFEQTGTSQILVRTRTGKRRKQIRHCRRRRCRPAARPQRPADRHC